MLPFRSACYNPLNITRKPLAYYRIKPRWRKTGLKTPPATENLLLIGPGANSGYTDVYQLERPHVEYLRRLNTFDGDTRSWAYIAVPNAGIFNYTRLPDGSLDYEWYEKGQKPFLNCVGFDGNIVNVIEIWKKFALVESINTNKYVPLFTYYNRPDLVHQFTVVNNLGRLYKAGDGLTVYSPVFTRRQSALPLDTLEPFPKLPRKVTVEWAAGLDVRQLPGMNSIRFSHHSRGSEIDLIKYYPRGAEVWARIESEGFVCLYMPGRENPYSTSWKMQTSPPPL